MGAPQNYALTLTRPDPHPPRAARPVPRRAPSRVPCPLPRLQPQVLLLFPRGWPCSPQRRRRAARRRPRPRVQGQGPRRQKQEPPRGPRRSRCSSSSRWERQRTETTSASAHVAHTPAWRHASRLPLPPRNPSLPPRLSFWLRTGRLNDTDQRAETKPWRTALAEDGPPPTVPYS